MDPRQTGRSRASLLVLYVTFLSIKLVWVGSVLLVPWVVRLFVVMLETSLMRPLSTTYTVSRVWLAPFAILTVLSVGFATLLVMRAAGAPAQPQAAGKIDPALARLSVAWFLLDSICLYGFLSKCLRYPNFWCYGFIVLSLLLTIAAGWPLLRDQDEVTRWRQRKRS